MWLTSSSVGRKFVMALTGAALVLFVTFHCLMNSVAIFWPTAYNAVCEFLGANWYALIASAGLALLIVIHIIYACWLTLQNRAARGAVRYSIESRPASVEWASKNMLVLGIVVLAFLGVHLIQFWAKMQLVEVLGCEGEFPAAAGTLFLQSAFSCWVTPVVYAIGFIALWLHMNHGFWSMFQSVGWDNTTWIPRLKCIGKCWVGVVMVLFFAQLAVFTFNANREYYLKDDALRAQYQEMVIDNILDKANFSNPREKQQIEALKNVEFADAAQELRMMYANIDVSVDVLGQHEKDFKGIKELEDIYANAQEMLPLIETSANTMQLIEPATKEQQDQIDNVYKSKADMEAQIPEAIEYYKQLQQNPQQNQQQMAY